MRRLLLAALLAAAPSLTLAQPADLLVTNARIHTMAAAGTIEGAVAIRGGRIAALGAEALALRGPATEVLDAGGRTVVPGLIDSHLHMHFAGLNAPLVQLLEARSIADIQARIRERAAVTPRGEWIQASSGWHESLIAEGRLPTRWELDEAAPDHPVFIPRGGHVVTINSAALRLARITRETPQPPGGVIVKREDGEPTGVLLIAGATMLARRVLPAPPPAAEQARLLQGAMRELNGFGITAVTEPGIDDAIAGIYRSVRDAGQATVRTQLLWRGGNRELIRRGIASQQGFASDDMLWASGIKIPLDGGVEGGRMREPYRLVPGEQTDPNYRGILLMPPGGREELRAALADIAAAGLQVQTHAVGDETIELITELYAEIAAERDIRPLRWTVMHIFLPSDAAIARMARHGILASAQNHPVLLGHNQRRWWGEERAARAIPIRALLDGGVTVGGGTDGPVVPIDPFLSMWWMTTRGTLMGYTLGPDQAITPTEALRLYTLGSAQVLGRERDLGSLEVGKLGDLVVLSQDILAVPPDAIRQTRALATVVGGRVVHRQGL
jgi:predicted amidohydrolase YtcJ